MLTLPKKTAIMGSGRSNPPLFMVLRPKMPAESQGQGQGQVRKPEPGDSQAEAGATAAGHANIVQADRGGKSLQRK